VEQSIGYIAVIVADYDEAIRFYVGILGFILVEDTYIAVQDKRWILVAPPASTGPVGRSAMPRSASRAGTWCESLQALDSEIPIVGMSSPIDQQHLTQHDRIDREREFFL
jgi:catechol 2,3-dioxygenase-like lactoylglutathione lyase family enzyme